MNNSTFDFILKKLNLSLFRKVPIVIQTETAECGLACLAMICHYHGLQIDLLNLRSKYGYSTRGVTLANLIRIAESLNLKSRAISLDIEEIILLKTPCILHWDLDHFVVLVSANSKYITIHDPAFGRKKISYSEASNHFTGISLDLWPNVEFKPIKQKSNLKLINIIKNIHGFNHALFKIFCLSVIVELINILIPIGTQLVLDHVILASDFNLLTLICICLISLILIRTFLSMLRTWISLTLSVLIDIQWKNSVFGHLIKLSLTYFEKRKLGDIQSRFNSLEIIKATFTNNIVEGIINILVLVCVLIMLFLYGGVLAWVVLAFTSIYIFLRLSTYNYYKLLSEEKIIKDARVDSHFMESLYSISTLKSLGIADMRSMHWLNLNIESANSNIKLEKMNLVVSGIGGFIATFDQIIILFLGASLIIENGMTLGMFVAFNVYRSQFSERASNLINIILELRILKLHKERIADIVLTKPEMETSLFQLIKKDTPASLKLVDLSFSYDPLLKPIINNLNLDINAGENIAIVGSSGCGKTTLLKLMCGLLTPDKGSIFINEFDINLNGLNNYRNCIASVLQDDKLISGSLSENISGFTPNPDLQLIEECARRCNIHNEILKMPMGYDSLVGELGGNLSGGQKQRIMIARALYRKPSILFMDEATSHLDLDNESFIIKSLSELNITRIFIAHRPSTIESANKIFDIEKKIIRNNYVYNNRKE